MVGSVFERPLSKGPGLVKPLKLTGDCRKGTHLCFFFSLFFVAAGLDEDPEARSQEEDTISYIREGGPQWEHRGPTCEERN